MVTTAQLHAEADRAAQNGAFTQALALAGEVLRSVPHDHRARIKVGLCLAALGRAMDGASALLIVARGLGRRGFALAAIGACRDALQIAPQHPGIRKLLESLHDDFGGIEGPCVSRVPPPIAPAEIREGDAGRLHAEAPDLIERARALAMSDPDAGIGSAAAEPQPVPFFSDLSKAVFLDIVERMVFQKLATGATVVQQGDPGGSLFILVSGEVEVSKRDGSEASQVLARLGSGHLFGEMSLLTRKPRTASVRTIRPTELFEIGREAIETVATRHPSLVEDLVRFARRRMLANLMATSPVFRTLASDHRLEVVQAFETRMVKPGETLIAEGEPPVGLFLVLEGELEVTTFDASGDQMVLAYLREGEVVGEISLIEKGPTTATVAATERSVVLHLPKSKFDGMVSNHPELEAYLKKLSADRMVETEEASSTTLAIDADELVLI